LKHINNKSIRFIHSFFVIKDKAFYQANKEIIDEFKQEPGLFHISERTGLNVDEVYNIVKTHDINVLNTNIIKLMECK
tara:strand:- start:178 stop:411 length:234 start_codon:yes stop_codon:yes gene_type:complete